MNTYYNLYNTKSVVVVLVVWYITQQARHIAFPNGQWSTRETANGIVQLLNGGGGGGGGGGGWGKKERKKEAASFCHTEGLQSLSLNVTGTKWVNQSLHNWLWTSPRCQTFWACPSCSWSQWAEQWEKLTTNHCTAVCISFGFKFLSPCHQCQCHQLLLTH